MYDITVNAIIPILSVFIGGIITYYIGKKELRRNKLIEVYLELLNVIQGRYYECAGEYTEEYLNILRKMYLVASPELLNILYENQFIPPKDKKWSENKIEDAFENIVVAMRKDIGNSNRTIKKLQEYDINFNILYAKPKQKTK